VLPKALGLRAGAGASGCCPLLRLLLSLGGSATSSEAPETQSSSQAAVLDCKRESKQKGRGKCTEQWQKARGVGTRILCLIGLYGVLLSIIDV